MKTWKKSSQESKRTLNKNIKTANISQQPIIFIFFFQEAKRKMIKIVI